MHLEGTETQKNLARAFAGESQARNRYDFTAEQLRKEGQEYLYRVISEISRNEHAHARIFWDYLVQGTPGGFPNIAFDAGYPFSGGDSLANLQSAAHGEAQEATEIYPKFAEIARSENFPEIAASFEQIARIEASHNQIFTTTRSMQSRTRSPGNAKTAGIRLPAATSPRSARSATARPDFSPRRSRRNTCFLHTKSARVM